ncbi:glycosyltransferase family 4 protein [Streptomyces acidiscabies]|uniref:glycosyltransferase family 4 protein n=1 Tax=Streptomyces acidiscabies TaxID=42234 RepID=UPI00273E890B|nr:glycosyltransferase family 4 protein [Streptomyces acidiscabies]
MSAPGGTATPLRIVARVHAMPPEHNAGAEHMLVSMLRPLVERGHEVSVWLSRYGRVVEPYEYRGVQVVPLEARLDFPTAVRRADVLVSHLECVPSTAALARGYGKPMTVVCHNTHRPTFRDAAAGGTALAVYNSEWMRREAELFFAEYPQSVRPDRELVVRPPVFADEYAAKPGDRVTLVNCNAEKGGRVLEALARRMPDVQFLAVRGAYGEQILPDLQNVEVVEHVRGEDMREHVYARTRVLLMPSSYESWGRAGVEALASGIPVVAHPTPGLCESLGEGGVFVDRNDLDGYEAVLRKLLAPSEFRLASKRAKARSAELDPTDELAAWCAAVESLPR